MRTAHHFFRVLDAHVRVHLRGPQARLSVDRLEVAKVRLIAQHVGGHRMPQGMRADLTPLLALARPTMSPTARAEWGCSVLCFTRSAFSVGEHISRRRSFFSYASLTLPGCTLPQRRSPCWRAASHWKALPADTPSASAPRWHLLYFFPLPHQQGSFRPGRPCLRACTAGFDASVRASKLRWITRRNDSAAA